MVLLYMYMVLCEIIVFTLVGCTRYSNILITIFLEMEFKIMQIMQHKIG